MKKKDYYEYWYEKNEKKGFVPREIKSLSILKKIITRNNRILDVGCGKGRIIEELKKVRGTEVFGIDVSRKSVDICKKKGLNVKRADAEKMPFPSSSFEIVYAGEVIEHLYNPDAFLEESWRVLKERGRLLITTPNLSNWYNRILFLFGIQPVFIETSTKSSMVGAGILKRLKKDSTPIGHIRIFNVQAIKDILELNGFRTLKLWGSEFEHFPRKIRFLDRFFSLFPRLASEMIILAEKDNNL